MPELELDFHPTEILILSAIGKPGDRTFFLRGGNREQTVTLRIEKFQVQMLAVGAAQFLMELKNRFPDLEEPVSSYDERRMVVEPPIDPLFHIAEMSMGYDIENDLVVLIFEEGKADDAGAQKPSVVRFWCTRSELAGLAAWTAELVSRGRPTSAETDENQKPEDGFLPRNNGHKH